MPTINQLLRKGRKKIVNYALTQEAARVKIDALIHLGSKKRPAQLSAIC